MAQRHMDRLTSFDTSFLANEKANGHMAIGAMLVCEGSAARRGGLPRPHPQPRAPAAAPAPAAALPAAGARHAVLGRLPRLRHPPPRAPRRRCRRRATEAQFQALVGELLAPPLDRAKPLWELILVEGFDDDRFAIVYKTHHAMADGISAVDIGMLLFDVEPKRGAGPRRGALGAGPRRPRAPALLGRAGAGIVGTAAPALAAGCGARRRRARPRPPPRRRRPRRPLGGDLEPGPAGAAGPVQHRPIGPGRELLLDDLRPGRVQARSRTRSAAPSTTSRWPSPPAPCAAGCSERERRRSTGSS